MFNRKYSKEMKEYIRKHPEMTAKEASDMFHMDLSDSTMYYIRHKRKKNSPCFLCRSVGSERKDKDGYIRVMLPDGTEKLKHHIVWGKPVQSDECLIFLDGDKTNCKKENLCLIKRKYLGKINSLLKGQKVNRDLMVLAINTAILYIESKNAEIKNKFSKRNNPKKDNFIEYIKLYNEGLKPKEISDKTKKNISTVRWTLRRYRLGVYDALI